MKVILALVCLGLGISFQAQSPRPEASDLLVLRFSCGTVEEHNGVVRSVQDPDPPMNEPITIVQQPKNEPQEVKNRREMQARQAELRGLDAEAVRSRQRPATNPYFYHLEIRNTGQKTMKTFAWQYQPAETADALDRQFFCSLNAKPNASKVFDIFSPLAPSRVVDASHAGIKNQKEKIVINQINYTDGSVWVRPGWNPATFSSDATSKVESGKCIGL
jgi:hypothetical protein